MKPRLLFIINDLGPGGAQPMNLRLARQLQSRGYPVRLVTLFKRPWFEPLDPSGLEVVRLNAKGAEKPLVVFRLVPLVKQADIVIGGEDMAATNYGWLAATMAHRPFLAWTHISFHRHLQRAGWLDRSLSRWIRRYIRWTVFPSHGALDSLRQVLEEQPPNSIWQVIENFLDPWPKPGPAPPDRTIFSKPVVLGIGRLAAQKAFDRLIRAHAALRRRGLDHHLVILGEGPKRRELEAEVKRLRVTESVFLSGHVENVGDWLGHAAVFALCSRYEALPLVLLEALSCGVPSVAMDCPAGPREILQDRKAGLLVSDGDEAAFQEAIARLLTSLELRQHYAEQAQVRAQYYTPERIVPKWEALLAEVAASGR